MDIKEKYVANLEINNRFNANSI